MHARIVTFQLDGLTHADYQSKAEAIAESFNTWPGLLAKLWLSDPRRRRYGGIYLFRDAAAAEAANRAPQTLAMAADPAFTDVNVEQFEILAGSAAITAGALLSGLRAAAIR